MYLSFLAQEDAKENSVQCSHTIWEAAAKLRSLFASSCTWNRFTIPEPTHYCRSASICVIDLVRFICVWQHHRNQRNQEPLWWRVAVAFYTLLFRRDADARDGRANRRWNKNKLPSVSQSTSRSGTFNGTVWYLTRVLRGEKQRLKRRRLRRTGDGFLW